MSEKQERPYALATETHRIETGYGRVYVQVGIDEDGDPFEVFVNAGQSGGHTNAWCEALAKMVSNALRCGADAEELCDDLMGIRTDKLAEDNGDTIYSIPDAVGVALLRTTRGVPAEQVRDSEPVGAP